jgi:hypothetical protein
LLGALLAPFLLMLGYLVLGWAAFDRSTTSTLAPIAGVIGVSLGACCFFPLLRVPGRLRLALLCIYVVALSVGVLCFYFLCADLEGLMMDLRAIRGGGGG